MPYDINSQQVDIENLFKQNANDLSSIKELYRKLKDLEKKITQIKYIDSNLTEKLKSEYESLKKVILDENIQIQLTNDINKVSSQLDTIAINIEKFPRLAIETSDSKRLERALNNIPNNAIIQFNNNSEYIFNTQVKSTKNVHFKGVGRVTFKSNSSIRSIIKSTAENINITFDNIEFIGGVIDENDTYSRDRKYTPSFEVAFEIENANKVIIENCVFRNIKDIPIYVYNSKSVTFKDNIADYCFDFGFTNNDKIIIDGNRITRSGDNGLSVSRYNEQCIITNNIVENSFFSGIFVAGFIDDPAPEKFICTNNIILNSNRFGIQADGGASKFIICDNYIDNVTRKYEEYNPGYLGGIGILCAPSKNRTICEKFSITNNTILDCERGGMLISGLQYGKITDNLISNPGIVGLNNVDAQSQPNNYMIALTSSANTINIKNNTFIDNRTDKSILKYCIFANSSISGNIIEENTLIGVPHQFVNIPIDVAKNNSRKWYSNTFLKSKNYENGNTYNYKFGQATLSTMNNILTISCIANQDCGAYVDINNYSLKNKINFDITFKSSNDIDSVGLLFDFMKKDGKKDRKLIKFSDLIINYEPNTIYSISGILETTITITEFSGYQCIICGNMNSLSSNRTAKDIDIYNFNLY